MLQHNNKNPELSNIIVKVKVTTQQRKNEGKGEGYLTPKKT